MIVSILSRESDQDYLNISVMKMETPHLREINEVTAKYQCAWEINISKNVRLVRKFFFCDSCAGKNVERTMSVHWNEDRTLMNISFVRFAQISIFFMINRISLHTGYFA